MGKRKKVLVDADWFKLTNYKAWEQPEFTGIVEVTTTDTYTVIFGVYSDMTIVEKMYIDGVLLDEPVKQYTFDTLGEHTIRCVFKKDAKIVDRIDTSTISFFGKSNIVEILDIKYDNLEQLFCNANNLKHVNLSNFLSNSKNTKMNDLFNNLDSKINNIEEIDLSAIDLSNIIRMDDAFNRCPKLRKVKMMGDVSKAEYVTYMFGGSETKAGSDVENPKFYYDARYDYSKIIAELPENWTAVPVYE